MNRETCSRQWEVEADRDGRLGPRERDSFARHLASCGVCARELRALDELEQAMAALPTGAKSELEHRRTRQALLRAAGALSQARPSVPRFRSRAAVALVAVASMAAGAFFMMRQRDSSRMEYASPTFEVVDVDGADWSAEVADGSSRVSLRRGVADFRVDKTKPNARFIVSLPDGEIEVRGTRFVVDVQAGRTTSVTVTEGTIELRVPGYSGRLSAGERWPYTLTSVPSTGPSREAAVIAAPSTVASVKVMPSASHVAPTRVAPAASPPVAASSSQSAGASFSEAMGAYSAGDYGRADVLLLAFIRQYPRDARVEDAMYLRADARARMGDVAGARLLAKQYLAAFPNGLRRLEAKRIAGE